MAHLDPRIAAVIARMEDTLAHGGSLDELAALANLSRSRLAHLFRRETGSSLARYRHRLRMEHARLLLERTFLTVKQVMACVGVNDPSHFARDFRRHHGAAPTQLRLRSWTARARSSALSDRPTGDGDGQQTGALPPVPPRYRTNGDTKATTHEQVNEPRRKRS